jgi:hypothetical protein
MSDKRNRHPKETKGLNASKKDEKQRKSLNLKEFIWYNTDAASSSAPIPPLITCALCM